MPTRPNSRAAVHATGVQHHSDGMHPYESVDRFAPSISLQIRNSRRQGTINSVQDIDLPPSLSHRGPRREGSDDGTSLDGRVRSSFESGRSRLVTTETRNQSPGPGQSSRPIGSVIELERRTVGNRRTSSYLSQPTLPEESVLMQEARSTYRNPSRKDRHDYPPPEAPAADIHKRSNASMSFITHRHRQQRPSYSDSFLPAPYDEEKAESKTSGSPHSKSLRSPRIGGRASLDEETTTRDVISIFLLDIVPHQVYLHCLLRLPYMYFARVDQIFESANLTLEQMKDMALQVSVECSDDQYERAKPEIPKGYWRLKKAWERFIDNLLREWKTLNIISGLLLSGILTIFQIDGTQRDPVTRYMAFWSLISALLSLLYGCIFIIRFSGLRSVYQATEWAVKAQQSQALLWNVWIMLAMPAVWLVWSILAYIACIMAFMWRVTPDDPKPTLGHRAEICFKIFICCVLGLGILYAILIVNTLRQYGSAMDKSWRSRIAEFRSEQMRKAPETPTLSPLLGMHLIEPTPPHTFNRLSSASPKQSYRPSSPRAANQVFAHLPYIPAKPSIATKRTMDTRESFDSSNPPSPTDFGQSHKLNLDRDFSASPTAMTPEPTTPPQHPLRLTPDDVPNTPKTRKGTLGLIFDEDRERLEGPASPLESDDRPEGNTRQRTGEGETTTEPDSDTTLVAQATESEDSDPMHNNERVEDGRDELQSQSLDHFRPNLSHKIHLSP